MLGESSWTASVLVGKYPRATFESDRITVARYSHKRVVVEKLTGEENR